MARAIETHQLAHARLQLDVRARQCAFLPMQHRLCLHLLIALALEDLLLLLQLSYLSLLLRREQGVGLSDRNHSRVTRTYRREGHDVVVSSAVLQAIGTEQCECLIARELIPELFELNGRSGVLLLP